MPSSFRYSKTFTTTSPAPSSSASFGYPPRSSSARIVFRTSGWFRSSCDIGIPSRPVAVVRAFLVEPMPLSSVLSHHGGTLSLGVGTQAAHAFWMSEGDRWTIVSKAVRPLGSDAKLA